MFPIQLDPEEMKRQQQLQRARMIDNLRKLTADGFWKYILRNSIFPAGALIYASSREPIRIWLIVISIVASYGILIASWFSHKKTLEKLEANNEAKYDEIILPPGNGWRLLWFALAGFALMFAIIYYEAWKRQHG